MRSAGDPKGKTESQSSRHQCKRATVGSGVGVSGRGLHTNSFFAGVQGPRRLTDLVDRIEKFRPAGRALPLEMTGHEAKAEAQGSPARVPSRWGASYASSSRSGRLRRYGPANIIRNTSTISPTTLSRLSARPNAARPLPLPGHCSIGCQLMTAEDTAPAKCHRLSQTTHRATERTRQPRLFEPRSCAQPHPFPRKE